MTQRSINVSEACVAQAREVLHVGRALVYISLAFSLASAAQYVSLFREAVEAKERKRQERL